ncbi:actin nucleation-promoting factor WAS-like isoform X2 [Elgaria multicarinata webbii]|uniref:actin nucleation-promoting factor WAS-like isoform X2 n=1 Tax=Elgaria multicarinata webbii TaxID=159646 RepID=UPI002FCD533C
MEEEAEVLMDQTESAPENIEITETKKKGPRGRGRGRGGRGYARGKMRGRALNGFGPIRRGMGRMRPYPDARGRRGARGGPLFPPSLPTRGMMRMPFLPPPPRYGAPLPPFPPPPPGIMGFRGRPPPPRARGMLPWPRGYFPPSRGIT